MSLARANWQPVLINGQCPELARGHCCRLAAQIAALPVDYCPVTEEQCKACSAMTEPTPDEPNEIVATVALEAVVRVQPQRSPKIRARLEKFLPATLAPPEVTEERFPCPHRRSRDDDRSFTCTPCDGGLTHPVRWCSLLMRDCTVHATRAEDENDGKRAECCIACEHLPSLARANLRPSINYIRSTSGQKAGEFWHQRFNGQTVFLVCGGPSLRELPLELLSNRGIVVAAVNNAGAYDRIRPHLWFCADSPQRFHKSIWADPACAKFVKSDMVGKPTRVDAITEGPAPYSFPNVWVYERESNPPFEPREFLSSYRPRWGNSVIVKQDGHAKPLTLCSTMLIAMRCLVDFGFTTINLIGCDFRQVQEDQYAWREVPSPGRVWKNNHLFPWLNEQFHGVRPILESVGVTVRNCTPGGNLDAFERADFREAVASATLDVGELEGHYVDGASNRPRRA